MCNQMAVTGLSDGLGINTDNGSQEDYLRGTNSSLFLGYGAALRLCAVMGETEPA